MFDSFKRLLGRSSKEEQKTNNKTLIDEELDQFERELQESMAYMEERNNESQKPEISQPQNLGVGGAVGNPSLITPEARKKIEDS